MRQEQRYHVVKVTDIDGEGNDADTFRIRDTASNNPYNMLLEVVFSTEESARAFVEKINSAPSDET